MKCGFYNLGVTLVRLFLDEGSVTLAKDTTTFAKIIHSLPHDPG